MGTRAIITHPTNPSGTALRIEPHFESAFCTPNRSVPNAAVVNVLGTSGDFTRISYQSTDHELIGWVRSALLSMLPNFGGTSATEILAPTTVGDCFLEFKLGPETGLRVPPQEQAPLLGLPPQYHHLTVRTIVLLHRKDLHNEEDMVSWPDHGGASPGLSPCLVASASLRIAALVCGMQASRTRRKAGIRSRAIRSSRLA